MEHPSTHIRLEKLQSLPGRPDGEGSQGPIKTGYYVLGYSQTIPVVGEPFEMFRYERNGVQTPGYFASTPVIGVWVEGDGTTIFETKNSVYSITPIKA